MSRKTRPELWAGFECTVNRVGDTYFDQLERTGHSRRIEDLELLKWLGVAAVRYPVLWERTAATADEAALRRGDVDWSWSDARLSVLREMTIRPIVGLLHHGSGPRDTSLVDPRFPEKLAAFARAVAERYPWVEDWTPVNEPLTTARFSTLYGLWFPHGRDLRSFTRALVNQCRGVASSMLAIREVNPAARLVTTEDLGRASGTSVLEPQLRYEAHRRLASLDLLTGRVTRQHPMWVELLSWGASEAELEWFVANPCRVDTLGINYYVTSDRFLDHRLSLYPAQTAGGNGVQRYCDVEAVRVSECEITGHLQLLREMWDLYQVPLAITEVHLGCTREEQLRWLMEAWEAAIDAADEGLPVRGVTAWSLLGAFDWDKLLVRAAGSYEPGVFDIGSAFPRPTALAHAVRSLALEGSYRHPVLASPGWWRRPERVLFGDRPIAIGGGVAPAAPPLLITGANGTLGQAFRRIAEARGLRCIALTRADLDITEPTAVAECLKRVRPWAVVNAAGYVRVDDAETDVERCWRENVVGPSMLANACRVSNVPLVTFSSDLVFDGRSRARYSERSQVRPLSLYGASKRAAEVAVLDAMPSALVVRTAAFFGPWDRYNFVHTALRHLCAGESFPAADDVIVSPTYVPDLVNATLDLLIDGESGLWHIVNDGELSWAEWAVMVAKLEGLEESLVKPSPAATMGLTAERPAFSALGSERGRLLRPVEAAMAAYASERVAEPSEELALRRTPSAG